LTDGFGDHNSVERGPSGRVISLSVREIHMTTFGAGAAFDMADFIATGSLAEFFDLGTPVSGTT